MSEMTLALAQISPVWLNRDATLEKIITHIEQAAEHGAQLVVFGESLLPGYPYWLELTGGAEFNSEKQKKMFAHYALNAVNIEQGDLDSVQKICQEKSIALYLGCIETTASRGHSLYCSMVYIDAQGKIGSVHRKLMPTYEERLVWSPGDGNGLQVHALDGFIVGGLNCWENWIPMARQALYAQGENLHVAIWPGNVNNTKNITRFIAKEARSFVVSVGNLFQLSDIPDNTPLREDMVAAAKPQLSAGDPFISNGGSCIAGPDGEWIIEPIAGKEGITLASINLQQVLEERQNFDPAGHYSRPDVLQLKVNRERQTSASFIDD